MQRLPGGQAYQWQCRRLEVIHPPGHGRDGTGVHGYVLGVGAVLDGPGKRQPHDFVTHLPLALDVGTQLYDIPRKVPARDHGKGTADVLL